MSRWNILLFAIELAHVSNMCLQASGKLVGWLRRLGVKYVLNAHSARSISLMETAKHFIAHLRASGRSGEGVDFETEQDNVGRAQHNGSLANCCADASERARRGVNAVELPLNAAQEDGSLTQLQCKKIGAAVHARGGLSSAACTNSSDGARVGQDSGNSKDEGTLSHGDPQQEQGTPHQLRETRAHLPVLVSACPGAVPQKSALCPLRAAVPLLV
jgi:iron only hydrogenase large subunit-like protein